MLGITLSLRCFCYSFRFLIKKNKVPGEEDGSDATETAAAPTPPVAKESTFSPSSQPNTAPSHPETTATEVPIKNASPASPTEALPAPTPASTASTLPVQQDALRPKSPPVGTGMPAEDGEEAGPSGMNSHPSSSSAAPTTSFIPFSGGGQRLGGPGGASVGRTLSSSSSTSLSALTSAVGSPKAKKAKSNYGSRTKVKHLLSGLLNLFTL